MKKLHLKKEKKKTPRRGSNKTSSREDDDEEDAKYHISVRVIIQKIHAIIQIRDRERG